MLYFIGTDEAGYGPNLGPLVVSATVWSYDDTKHPAIMKLPELRHNTSSCDLFTREEVIRYEQSMRDPNSPNFMLMHAFMFSTTVKVSLAPVRKFRLDDSKKVYRKGQLSSLERSILAVLGTCRQWTGGKAGKEPQTWSDLIHQLGSSDSTAVWDRDFDGALPLDSRSGDAAELAALSSQIRGITAKNSFAIEFASSLRIYPEDYNLMLEGHLKSDILAAATLTLVRQAVDRIDEFAPGTTEHPTRIIIICDKLGGRNSYAPYILPFFPDWVLHVEEEGDCESVYSLCGETTNCSLRFRSSGEEHVAVALSSMISKYLREVSMGHFNRYWQEKVPDLAPTAGYPADARRFWRDTADARLELRLPDSIFWRNK